MKALEHVLLRLVSATCDGKELNKTTRGISPEKGKWNASKNARSRHRGEGPWRRIVLAIVLRIAV